MSQLNWEQMLRHKLFYPALSTAEGYLESYLSLIGKDIFADGERLGLLAAMAKRLIPNGWIASVRCNCCWLRTFATLKI
jgi:hypothetical protein